MRLREYFESTGIKRTFFAKKVGCTVSQLSHWERGGYVPSIVYALRIEACSSGKVSLKDWLDVIEENENEKKEKEDLLERANRLSKK